MLGVAPGATQEAIRRAYREAARRLHPDVNPSPSAAKDFTRVQEAYELLSDRRRREAYDRARRGEPEPAEPDVGSLHVNWQNVAEPRGRGGRKGGGKQAGVDAGDPTGFEELYRAFFQTRLDDAKRAAKG